MFFIALERGGGGLFYWMAAFMSQLCKVRRIITDFKLFVFYNCGWLLDVSVNNTVIAFYNLDFLWLSFGLYSFPNTEILLILGFDLKYIIWYSYNSFLVYFHQHSPFVFIFACLFGCTLGWGWGIGGRGLELILLLLI